MSEMKLDAHSWDFFIAYPSTEKATAESLYKLLKASARTFWDGLLQPGVKWPIELEKAQRLARFTIVMVTGKPINSNIYYLDEIERAIRLNKITAGDHKVIPVFIENTIRDVPYGLAPFQSIKIEHNGGLSRVAELLIQELRRPRRTSWKDYDGLFNLDGYQLAYLPLLNGSCADILELGMADVKIIRDMHAYRLPSDFRNTIVRVGFSNDLSCRLASYDFSTATKLRLTLSETSYADYLKSGEHLDDPMLRGEAKTFRDEFGNLVRDGHHNLRPFGLTNITGVGVFLITKDHHIIVSRHSKRSHVYPGRWTFSSSGVMKWGAHPHPFQEAGRKCHEELRHQVNIEALRLIGFGADARKLYFQFIFVENTDDHSTEIINRSRTEHELLSVPFELDEIVRHLIDNCWEPAAEAALLTLSAQKFGRDRVVAELKAVEDRWGRKQMLDEWDLRAGQMGFLPVMSVRYPELRRERLSKSYVNAVIHFIGDDMTKKRVLEVGCGMGRITKELGKRARNVTAIDLCERMIEKATVQIGNQREIKFERCFAQDHKPAKRYDVTVCSLVLAHNVANMEFSTIVSMMCQNSNVVFVFEDVTEGRPTSPHTQLRSKKEMEQEFLRNGFSLAKKSKFKLYDDRLVFLKFVRSNI